MAKYDEQFKTRAVKAYLSGGLGFGLLAAKLGVKKILLQRWVAAFREHGSEGLRKKFSHYDAQFKLDVLHRMWTESLSGEQVAAIFGIRSPGCIALWERQYHSGGIDALAPRRRRRPQAMQPPENKPKPVEDKASDERTREQLLKENECLRAEVAYLKKLDALVQAKKAAQRKKRK